MLMVLLPRLSRSSPHEWVWLECYYTTSNGREEGWNGFLVARFGVCALDKDTGKAATMFSRLTKRVWLNKRLMAYTKIQVYRACVLSTLLYCSESWTLHAQQERKLNMFHMHCLQWIFGITWQDKVPNRVVLD